MEIRTLFERCEAAGDLTFSIVIPTWNNLEYLKLCLRSLATHSRRRHQVILHVNQGADGTAEWLADNFDGDVCLSEENVGICHALNYARRLMKTDYLLYMNDDMYVCPGWDEPLWGAVERAPSKMFYFSATLMQPGPFNDPSVLSECNYGRRLEDFDEERLLRTWNDREFRDWSGATWPPSLVHVDLWDQVGGYSVEFSPGMYSDPDFSMKLWNLGVRDFRGIAASRVYHFTSVSTGRVKKNSGSATFLRKWGMTSATFGRHYLRRGQPYRGPLDEPERTLGFYWDVYRSKIKRWLVSARE